MPSFESPIWDTMHVSHGIALWPHESLWRLHGELVEIHLEPLRRIEDTEAPKLVILPHTADEQRALGPRATLPELDAYTGRHFLYLSEQVNAATIGRSPRLDPYAGWICRVTVDRVAIDSMGPEFGAYLAGMMAQR